MVPVSTVLAAAAVAALIVSPAPVAAPAPSSVPSPVGPTSGTPVTAPTGRTWQWPLAPRPEVARRFAVGPETWSAGHRGADLVARPGQAIRAPAPGVVYFVGVVAGRPVLSIAHAGGLISSFEPVVSTLRPGEAVVAGAVIGTTSVTPGHCSPRSCVHWGVRRDGAYLDPLLLVRDVLRPIVLKPLAGLEGPP